jgi:hypothetical protein
MRRSSSFNLEARIAAASVQVSLGEYEVGAVDAFAAGDPLRVSLPPLNANAPMPTPITNAVTAVRQSSATGWSFRCAPLSMPRLYYR